MDGRPYVKVEKGVVLSLHSWDLSPHFFPAHHLYSSPLLPLGEGVKGMIFDILRPKNARICAGTLRGLMGGEKERGEENQYFTERKCKKCTVISPQKVKTVKYRTMALTFPRLILFFPWRCIPIWSEKRRRRLMIGNWRPSNAHFHRRWGQNNGKQRACGNGVLRNERKIRDHCQSHVWPETNFAFAVTHSAFQDYFTRNCRHSMIFTGKQQHFLAPQCLNLDMAPEQPQSLCLSPSASG